MTAKILELAIRRLKAERYSMRCSDLRELLESLGFYIKDGKNGGHKLYFHDHLDGFFSSGFDCGHGKNSQVKPVYVGNVLRVLANYETELSKYLEPPSGDKK